MFKLLLVLSIALMGLACADPGEKSADGGVPKTDQTAQQKPQIAKASVQRKPRIAMASVQPEENVAEKPAQIVFFDSRIFDDQLSTTMWKESPKITVNVPTGFSLNDIPDRFDRWLYSVKEGGGKVVAEPEHPFRTRGIISAVIDVVVSIFEKIAEISLYQPSEHYDATLLYGIDGTVNKIVFVRR